MRINAGLALGDCLRRTVSATKTGKSGDHALDELPPPAATRSREGTLNRQPQAENHFAIALRSRTAEPPVLVHVAGSSNGFAFEIAQCIRHFKQDTQYVVATQTEGAATLAVVMSAEFQMKRYLCRAPTKNDVRRLDGKANLIRADELFEGTQIFKV